MTAALPRNNGKSQLALSWYKNKLWEICSVKCALDNVDPVVRPDDQLLQT
jgi:hypothetical protein